MRYFLDCEFLESGGGRPIHLLSLGLVAEDGRELYLVNRDCPVEEANAFVREHVLPHIDMDDGVSTSVMRRRVRDFVDAGAGDPEFWSVQGAYDWVVFAGLQGDMSQMPDNWPHYLNDLKQWSRQLGLNLKRDLPPPPGDDEAHNALTDARWHFRLWQALSFHARRMSSPLA